MNNQFNPIDIPAAISQLTLSHYHPVSKRNEEREGEKKNERDRGRERESHQSTRLSHFKLVIEGVNERKS